MSRGNYRRELTSAVFLPFVLVFFEGSVLGVLVRIGFADSVDHALLNYVSGFISIIPAVANLSSFIWVRLSHGRHKVRAITRLLSVMLVSVLMLAFLPRNEIGLLLTAVCALVARLCWAGFITLRSTIWRQNYPTGARAQITGRFSQVTPLLIAVLSLVLGAAMSMGTAVEHWLDVWTLALGGVRGSAGGVDLSHTVFRIAVPIGCVMGFVGLMIWRRVRVREHRRLLRMESDSEGAETPSLNPVQLLGVLRQDREYAKFMGCQFLLGIGNITSFGLLPILLSEVFHATYFQGLLVSSVLSFGLMPLAVPLWARFLDRTHIVQYRSVHSWVFVAALCMLVLACFTERYELLVCYAVLKAVAVGGGMIAWTLGHLDFAPAHRSSVYMGVHVTLTGVRGVLAWALGVTVYELLESVQVGAGKWAVVGATCIAAMGAFGFVLLRGQMVRHGRLPREGQAAPAGPTNQGS